MEGDRREVTLSEVAIFSYGKMPNKDILNQGEFPTFSGYKYQHKYPKFNCDAGDVIVVARGVGGTGDVKLVKEKCYLTNLSIRIKLDSKQVNNRFFYYRFLNAGLRHLDSGSAQSQITINDLNNEIIILPPLPEQRAIAHILGTLDDKIELNRRMNATLEAMSQALFKSWFVDFDPVIDKALAAGNPIPEPLHKRAEARRVLGDQRRPLPAEIEDHFPDRFVFSDELGWIPEGWENLTFENLVDAKQGRYLPKTEMHRLPDEDFKYPVWGGNGILGYSTKKAYDKPIPLMTCRGSNCGLIKSTRSAAWVSNNAFACSPKVGSEYFLYLYFLNENFSECVSGSAQPQITYTALRNKSMRFPISHDACECFSEMVQIHIDTQTGNERQNETLTSLRDILLPRLLSGELRIPDAEKLIEEVL